ncbi:MAG: radical protein [Verrucomicrobia bacterium]|nr:radical protein [Verrucomicrobiota bacterium]
MSAIAPTLNPTPTYGFYDRLSPDFPSQLNVDVSEICNLACIHCPHPEFKKSEHYAARLLGPDLNKKVIDEVAVDGRGICEYIRYTSEGEPLLHKLVFEMLTYAKKNSGTSVTLTTNGVLLDDKRCERLLATGIDLVDISLDAYTPETYAKIRVKGDLTVTRKNVQSLIALARRTGSSTKIVVSYIEQPQNKHETDQFEKFWHAEGAHQVVVRRMHSAAGAVGDLAEVLRGQLGDAKRYPCLYPWERLCINPRGELQYCPQDWVHGSALFDLRNITIKAAWQSESYRALREAHLKNDFSRHKFCGQCPDWAGTRWPGAGRSYADMIGEIKAT